MMTASRELYIEAFQKRGWYWKARNNLRPFPGFVGIISQRRFEEECHLLSQIVVANTC